MGLLPAGAGEAARSGCIRRCRRRPSRDLGERGLPAVGDQPSADGVGGHAVGILRRRGGDERPAVAGPPPHAGIGAQGRRLTASEEHVGVLCGCGGEQVRLLRHGAGGSQTGPGVAGQRPHVGKDRDRGSRHRCTGRRLDRRPVWGWGSASRSCCWCRRSARRPGRELLSPMVGNARYEWSPTTTSGARWPKAAGLSRGGRRCGDHAPRFTHLGV